MTHNLPQLVEDRVRFADDSKLEFQVLRVNLLETMLFVDWKDGAD